VVFCLSVLSADRQTLEAVLSRCGHGQHPSTYSCVIFPVIMVESEGNSVWALGGVVCVGFFGCSGAVGWL
jgi:hypothetical protein